MDFDYTTIDPDWKPRTEKPAVPSWARKEAFEYHGYECAKCGYRYRGGIQVHHIIPVVAGGSNEPDNLIPLCDRCHAEWHHCIEGHMSFDEWRAYPPALFILKSLGGTTNDMTISEWIVGMLEVKHFIRQHSEAPDGFRRALAQLRQDAAEDDDE